MENKFISLVSDTTFKYMFKNIDKRNWFIDIIKDKTNIDLSNYTLIDNELNTGSKVKDYRLDLVFSNNEDTVIIEMNSSYSKATEIKSRRYLYRKAGNDYDTGEKFDENKKVTLITLNNYLNKNYNDVKIINSWLGSQELGKLYDDIEIFEIYLPNFHKMCYDKCNEIDKRLWLFSATTFEEMRKVVNDKNIEIIEELERLSMNDKFIDEYNYENVQRKLLNTIKDEGYQEGMELGIQEGIKQNQIKITKNLLKENIDINIISKTTGLTYEEIEKLNN